MPTHLPDISPWWYGFAASIPFLGVYAKNYLDTHKRIREAEAGIAETKLAITACRLDVEKKFASKGYLKDVEVRMTKLVTKVENAVIRLEEKDK